MECDAVGCGCSVSHPLADAVLPPPPARDDHDFRSWEAMTIGVDGETDLHVYLVAVDGTQCQVVAEIGPLARSLEHRLAIADQVVAEHNLAVGR